MKFAEFIREKNIQIATVAHDLGVTHEAVRLWIKGTRTPRPQMMRKIREYTGGVVQSDDFIHGASE